MGGTPTGSNGTCGSRDDCPTQLKQRPPGAPLAMIPFSKRGPVRTPRTYHPPLLPQTLPPPPSPLSSPPQEFSLRWDLGGVLEPKSPKNCVPKQPKSIFSFVIFHCFPQWNPGDLRGGGVSPPPPPPWETLRCQAKLWSALRLSGGAQQWNRLKEWCSVGGGGGGRAAGLWQSARQ